MDYCHITLLGRLSRDPELKYTPAGMALAKLGLAVSSGFGDKKSTSFFNVTAFGKTAEAVAAHLKKGDEILVDGEMRANSWVADGGEKKTFWEVSAHRIEFGRKAAATGERQMSEPDLPF